MTESSITASFGTYGIVSNKYLSSKLPSVLEIKALPNQLGYEYRIKKEYWVNAPSTWDEVPLVLIDHMLKLRRDFTIIPEGIDDNKQVLGLDQLRMSSNHYEHDLYSVADILDTDVSNRLLRSLSSKDYWRVERSGLGGRQANMRYTRKRSHTQIRHPLAVLDATLLGFDLAAVNLDDVTRYANTGLAPYFESILPIHSWIKSVNPRFTLEVPVLENEESNFYFPWVPFTLNYDRLMLMSEDFSLYIHSKIRGLVETRVMLEARSASDAGRNVSKALRQDNRTDSFTRDLASKINVNKASRLVKNLLMAGLHSHFMVEYVPKDFDTPDAAVLLDCLLIPLTGPARLYSSSSLRQCFNYLVKHLFSKIKGFNNAPPIVNEYGKNDPTPLFEWLDAESGNARPVARLATAALAYFSNFTDGEGPSANVAFNHAFRRRDRAWAITSAQVALPFHVRDNTVFKSFFPTNPHDTTTMNNDPDIWNLFNVFVSNLEPVGFTDSRGIIRDVKRILLDLTDKGSTYIEYAYRVMAEYERLFLYPFAYASHTEIDEHRKMFLTVDDGAIMSMLSVVDWKSTKIEVNDTNFIQEGITDIWAIQDIFSSLLGSRQILDAVIREYSTRTGIDATQKIGRSTFVKIAPKFFFHESSRHDAMWKLFSTVDHKILRDFLDGEAAAGRLSAEPSLNSFRDITFNNSQLWHYGWHIIHRPSRVYTGQALGVDMFSLSSIARRSDFITARNSLNRVDIDTENALSVATAPADIYFLAFPMLEYGVKLRSLAKFIRPGTVFRIFFTFTDAEDSKTMPWDSMLAQIRDKHFLVNVPLGWMWFFDETFDIMQRMMDQQDVTTYYIGRWFQAFAQNDNITVADTAYDADAILISANVFTRANLVGGRINRSGYFNRPFDLRDFVSINKYETTPFPKLALSQTTI
jgi:hypothetical protein